MRGKTITVLIKNPTSECSRKMGQKMCYHRNNTLEFLQFEGRKFPDSKGPLGIQYNE